MATQKSKSTVPVLSPELRLLQRFLRQHIAVLAGDIGERHLGHPGSYERALDYITAELRAIGYEPERHNFACGAQLAANLSVSVAGELTPDRVLVIGAHYDTIAGSPGANDNATGIASVIEIARMMRNAQPDLTVRFVFFANEEPPFFHTEEMGSWQYAHSLHREGVEVAGMINVESVGYFTDEPNSQHYPPALQQLYPSVGNFIAFASNVESTQLLRRSVEVFRRYSPVTVEAAAVPSEVPGIAWSDQWGFWEHGYPALMITDTAPFRYPHYHTALDTPDKLDYQRFTYVVSGIASIVRDLSIEE